MPSRPAPTRHVAILACNVRDQCALLARSLAELRSVPGEQVEEAFAAHLKDTRALEQTLAASVAQLNARRGEVQRLPAGARTEVEACVEEARRQLQAAATAYAELTDDLGHVLSAIRNRLDGVRQGCRILRGYRQAAR